MSMISGLPKTVLVAPDSFKGTLAAADVAEALGVGLRQAGWSAVDLCPVADGGEGTMEVLAQALCLERRRSTVSDPLGRPVEASFGLSEGRPAPAFARRGRGPAPAVAVIEVAAASGLGLVSPSERDARAAHTRGTGALISAAVAAGAEVVYVAAGGSATTDGGAGAVEAIADAGGLGSSRLVVLCDVRTPFEDAARVFAPQKGAGPAEVAELSERLHAFAERLPRDPRGLPLSGAAGGLAGGLWAACGAELIPGASFVLQAISFDSRLRVARAVVTGEGQLDEQSLAGKAISEVATRARQRGVPCFAVTGSCALERFGQRILDLDAVLQAGTPGELERAGAVLAQLLSV